MAEKNKCAWLDTEHPVYTTRKAEWERNERRLAGGDEVLDELVSFTWEVEEDGKARYALRQSQAIYQNFPDMLLSSVTGHLMREAPTVDGSLSFGTLGAVTRREGQRFPSLAELVYYNVDGTGNDGAQWENWWTAVHKRAGATGHRWLYVDTPPDVATSEQDAIDGIRPVLVEWSPLVVTNWELVRGRLVFAVVRQATRTPRVVGDTLEGNDLAEGYLLLVAAGYDALGPEFEKGGWFRFTAEREKTEEAGDWSFFGGQIPMWAHYYERYPGLRGRPAMGRSAIDGLGQAAVAYMNLDSAAQFDAWDAGSSEKFFLGVNSDTFTKAVKQRQKGSHWIAVEATPAPAVSPTDPFQGAGAPTMPGIYDGSAGAVTSGVFKENLDRIVENAGKMAAQEATSTPDSSGRSKEAGFSDIKAPKLSLQASELEGSQNNAIYFYELAFGKTSPTGSVQWTRQFNLLSLRTKIEQMFDLLVKAEVRSPSLTARAVAMAAREEGILTDDAEADMVEAELLADAKVRALGQMGIDLGFAPASAKVDAGMDRLEAMGLFTDPETGEPRMVEMADGSTRPLEEAVLEELEALAEAAAARDLAGRSPFDLGFSEPEPNGGAPREPAGAAAE